MEEKMYYTAQEIAQMLGISQGKAYKILREMNAQLKTRGWTNSTDLRKPSWTSRLHGLHSRFCSGRGCVWAKCWH